MKRDRLLIFGNILLIGLIAAGIVWMMSSDQPKTTDLINEARVQE